MITHIMLANTRTLIELVARHGNLSVPDLRSLTLLSPNLTIPREELQKRKLKDQYGTYYLSPENHKVYHGMRTTLRTGSVCSDVKLARGRYEDGLPSSECIFIKDTFAFLIEMGFIENNPSYSLEPHTVTLPDGTTYEKYDCKYIMNEIPVENRTGGKFVLALSLQESSFWTERPYYVAIYSLSESGEELFIAYEGRVTVRPCTFECNCTAEIEHDQGYCTIYPKGCVFGDEEMGVVDPEL